MLAMKCDNDDGTINWERRAGIIVMTSRMMDGTLEECLDGINNDELISFIEQAWECQEEPQEEPLREELKMNSKTVTIQTGNSDDKLTQKEWSEIVRNITIGIENVADITHFHACSEGSSPWKNAVWVFCLQECQTAALKEFLGVQCKEYNQDSIAWTEGKTEFVTNSSSNEVGE